MLTYTLYTIRRIVASTAYSISPFGLYIVALKAHRKSTLACLYSMAGL